MLPRTSLLQGMMPSQESPPQSCWGPLPRGPRSVPTEGGGPRAAPGEGVVLVGRHSGAAKEALEVPQPYPGQVLGATQQHTTSCWERKMWLGHRLPPWPPRQPHCHDHPGLLLGSSCAQHEAWHTGGQDEGQGQEAQQEAPETPS